MGEIQQQADSNTSNTVRKSLLNASGLLLAAGAGIGLVVDLLNAIDLGMNVILIAAGLALLLITLGILEDRFQFQGRSASLLAAIAAFALGAGLMGAGIRGTWKPQAVSTTKKSSCSEGSADGAPGSYANPAPKDDPSTGLTFCAVNLNDGRAVKGRYTLTGSVLGIAPRGLEVAIALQPDPGTCDTDGNRGTGGWFLVSRLIFNEGVAAWRTDRPLPYPESSSIQRNFFYVVAPPAALDFLQKDNEAHLGDTRYGGLIEPPQSIKKVSIFFYTPGIRRSC